MYKNKEICILSNIHLTFFKVFSIKTGLNHSVERTLRTSGNANFAGYGCVTQRSHKPNFHSLAHAPQTLFSPLTKKSGTKVHACLLACLPCVYVCTVVSFGERDKSITLGKCESNYIWYLYFKQHLNSSIMI